MMGWVGPGRSPSSEKLMGRAGPRPMRCELCMARSARPTRRPMCFDGPARTTAHEMCTIDTTSTTSTVPMRPPTCFDGPARAVAHEMWCITATATTFLVSGSLSKNSYVRTMHSGKSPRMRNKTICVVETSGQSLGTAVGVKTTLLAVSATQVA